MPEYEPLHYIDEAIEALFDTPPTLEKKPGCPNGFVWQETTYKVIEMVSEWHDYGRRGKAAKNMRPSHAELAAVRGSWGVGRDWFRVRTETGQIFDLYYDRSPKGLDQRKGSWRLVKEMKETEPN
jgi:hypothetical protein